MVTMSSRCQEAVESSHCLVKRETRCVLWSVPFKPHQLKTQIIGAEGFPRLSLRRRRHRLVRSLGRKAPQDPRPFRGCLLLSHRKARLAPSSSKARGLSPGGPSTLLRSRGRRSGTTWRRVSKHVSLRKEQGKEGKPLGVRQSDHAGVAGVKSHEWQPPLTRRSSPSR